MYEEVSEEKERKEEKRPAKQKRPVTNVVMRTPQDGTGYCYAGYIMSLIALFFPGTGVIALVSAMVLCNKGLALVDDRFNRRAYEIAKTGNVLAIVAIIKAVVIVAIGIAILAMLPGMLQSAQPGTADMYPY